MSRLQEPGGLLYEDDAALDELVRSLVSFGRPLTLERLEAESPEGRALRPHVRRPGVIVIRRTAATLFVRTRADWADYLGHLSSRITVNLPRLRKRAARVGNVRVEMLSPSPDETPALLDTVMAVEASGWKGRGGSAMLSRSDLRGFFGEYAAIEARRGRLRIARLWFGERVVATELALVAYGRWWQLKIGYDEAFAEYYPGLQLTHETVRYAFDQGLDAYEFLGSAASWERRWNPEERSHELVVVYPPALRAMGALLVDGLAHASRRLRRPAGDDQEAAG
jgi:CelD/BcsL family acetyltransferase involved in cellulose biosynthesis